MEEKTLLIVALCQTSLLKSMVWVGAGEESIAHTEQERLRHVQVPSAEAALVLL